MIDNKKFVAIVQATAKRIEDEKDFLTELDNAIGDGDHGINLARGFAAVEKKLPDLTEAGYETARERSLPAIGRQLKEIYSSVLKNY